MCRRYPTNVLGLQIICQFFPLTHVSSIPFLKIKLDRSVNGIGYIAFITPVGACRSYLFNNKVGGLRPATSFKTGPYKGISQSPTNGSLQYSSHMQMFDENVGRVV